MLADDDGASPRHPRRVRSIRQRNSTCDAHFSRRRVRGDRGPLGIGKTSLLRLLVAALSLCEGHMHRRAGLRVGYVPQGETINWNFPVTVYETVLTSRQARRCKPWTSATEMKFSRRDVIANDDIAPVTRRVDAVWVDGGGG